MCVHPFIRSILSVPETPEQVESLLTWMRTGRRAQSRSLSRCCWAEGPWVFLGLDPGDPAQQRGGGRAGGRGGVGRMRGSS